MATSPSWATPRPPLRITPWSLHQAHTPWPPSRRTAKPLSLRITICILARAKRERELICVLASIDQHSTSIATPCLKRQNWSAAGNSWTILAPQRLKRQSWSANWTQTSPHDSTFSQNGTDPRTGDHLTINSDSLSSEAEPICILVIFVHQPSRSLTYKTELIPILVTITHQPSDYCLARQNWSAYW